MGKESSLNWKSKWIVGNGEVANPQCDKSFVFISCFRPSGFLCRSLCDDDGGERKKEETNYETMIHFREFPRAPPNVTGGGTQISSRGFVLGAPKVASSFPQIFRYISSRDCEKDVSSYPLLIWQMTGFSEALMRERREYVGRYSLINSILQMWQNSSHRIVQYNTVLLTDCHIT